MKKRVWNSGPPQHIGWWNASIWKFEGSWRWWNGEYWSIACNVDESARSAGKSAAKKAGNQHRIEWSDYYPENARVPRVAP